MSGSIQVLRKHNGLELKIKNYFNLPEYFQVNGEQLHLLSVVRRLNAMIDTKNYLTWLKENLSSKLRT